MTTAQFLGGDVVAANVQSQNIAYPAPAGGLLAGDEGILVIGTSTAQDPLSVEPSGWTLQEVHNNASGMLSHYYTKKMDGGETGNINVQCAGITKFTLSIAAMRNVYRGQHAWVDQPSTTNATVLVPVVTGVPGEVQWITVWNCRGSTPPTAVTIPAGTTLVDQVFLTGGGAQCAAIARLTDPESDGSAGADDWVRNNAVSASVTTFMVPFIDKESMSAFLAA